MTWDMGTYIEGARLEQFAENTARQLAVRGRCDGTSLRRSMKTELKLLEERCVRIAAFDFGAGGMPEAARWLADNRYLALREGQGAADGLKGVRALPALSGGGGDMPAGWELARALLRCGAGLVDRERLSTFLTGVQKARALEERELHLFVPFLKLAAVQGASSAAEEVLLCSETGNKKRLAVLGELCRNIFSSLRFLGGENLTELFESQSAMEAALLRDPAGVYGKMDRDSRAYYRHSLSRTALKEGISEQEAARRALKAARESSGQRRHIGWHILKSRPGIRPGAYFCPIVAATLFFALLGGFITGRPWAAFILLAPVFAAVKTVADYIVLKAVPPRRVPAIDLEKGVPGAGRTLCVISALLTKPGGGEALTKQLEQFRIVAENCGKNLLFGLLCDLPDSKSETDSSERELIAEARREIEKLNEKYGGFYLITRPRSYNRRDKIWSGKERKRGAIAALAEHLSGGRTELEIFGGELKDIKFLITLDADTRPSPLSLEKLIGAMLHPLNAPVVEKGRVVSGHGIIVPAVEVELESSMKSRFSRIFAPLGGLDPYCGTRGEVYQDLFGRGSFTGKGIIHIGAFQQCMKGALPENRVLSHDLLEGEFLRSALKSDAEFTDAFPARAASFYSRLHRWVRGDWQIGAWLFKKVPRQKGSSLNPLDSISKFKIFDNLRRSLTPALTLDAVLMGFFAPRGYTGVAIAAAACFFIEVMLSGIDRGLSGRWKVQKLSFPTAVGVRGAFMRGYIKFILLPFEALLCLGAAFIALFRVLVTKRRLLHWVTASQGDSRKAAYLKKFLPAMAVGLLCLLFAPTVLGSAAGVLWLLSPLVCMWLDGGEHRSRPLSPADRAFLEENAAQMWQYFADHMNEENNYLPPDNVQIMPNRGVARRTSPTNIGLGLLSALAAADFGFIDRNGLLTLGENTLDTLEKMEKWRGHLYNWYSTADLSPLPPKVASFVDSGNLAGCLIAFANGLREFSDLRSDALAERCDRLWRQMDFGCMYDRSRRLFHLSADCRTGKLSEGFYDLLQSEARQTSYIAVATGQCDSRHWAALGRAELRWRGMQGMASWTGTMFEYLMPDLLLPRYRGSALSESSHYCAAAQIGAVKKGQVWGVSESAFAMLDESLNYRYKASGVQALGLKTGLDRDRVISPYSSFLALSVRPHQAVKNLRNIKNLSSGDRYGLYEALDFTPSRLSGRESFETVRCFMAHHLGMSIVAISNALCENVMRRRFMADAQMGAWSCLLKEKPSVDAPVIKPFFVPEPPVQHRAPLFSAQFRTLDPSCTRCAPLSNGAFSIVATDRGAVRETCHGKTLLKFGGGDGAPGMGVWFESEGVIYPLTPLGEKEGQIFWQRCGDRVVWEKDHGIFSTRLTLAAAAGADASVRIISIENRSRRTLRGQLIFAAEPQMAEDSAYFSHPAYSKLFIETKIHENAVEFSRRGTGDKCTMVFAVGREGFIADTGRPEAFGRYGLWSDLGTGGWAGLKNALENAPGGTEGPVTDPCLFLRCPVEVGAGSRENISAALAFGEGPEVMAAALRCCHGGEKDFSPRAGLQAGRLGLESRDIEAACALLSSAVFPPRSPLTHSRELLWKHGVSGDLPIFLLRCQPGVQESEISAAVGQFLWLKSCGVKADLIILTRDEAGYRQPVREGSWEAVCRRGGEELIGKKGGIHILSGLSEDQCRGVAAFACHVFGENPRSAAPTSSPATKRRVGHDLPSSGFDSMGGWKMEVRGRLPVRARSHVMAFSTFGAVFCETGCFGMWQGNARENKILPWVNDPLAAADGLNLRFETGDGVFSPFAAEDGSRCYVNYYPGYAIWEKQLPTGIIKTTVFVARGADALVVIVSGSDGRLTADPVVVMGSDNSHSRWVAGNSEGPFKYYVNNFGTDFAPQAVMCAASRATRGDRVFVIGCSDGELSAAKVRALFQPAAARQELAAVKSYWQEICSRVQVRSPWRDFDNYVNLWAPYQVIACRIFGRCSIYQCGGAYGFRDQLQDVCSVMPVVPELAAKQIIRCCENQFRQGDVAHWWHETKTGRRGVRTRYSDDLLWLPWAIGQWARQVEDFSLLETQVAYLNGEPLKEGETDRYFQFSVSGEKESVLLHGKRAIDMALARGVGEHGLCKILGGDWNDGMNLVGIGGRGESLWLTCLLILAIESCAPLFERYGIDSAPYTRQAEKYRAAVAASFRGDRFIRGYFDDGQVIGAKGCGQCEIDAISQGFAALVLKNEDAATGIKTALRELFDRENRVCRLFAPAFDGDGQNPGYIRNYPPGIRENGGQYTHGVIWLALGAFEVGLENEGLELLLSLLPGGRNESVYKAEPYVICADIYSEENLGTGGWSWYTGAAGWYWKVAMEKLAGLHCKGGEISRRGGNGQVKLFSDGAELKPRGEESRR
ncbi:MAG: hypothetical protein IJP23_05075 [Oscillospiraceae bacterium]|nr:hypothetical protein [Oscillospiraceae bacterium]